jgi:Ni/Co efflux regulator RcnB
MKKTLWAVSICAGLLLAASAPAWAHHAFQAEFDQRKPIKLEEFHHVLETASRAYQEQHENKCHRRSEKGPRPATFVRGARWCRTRRSHEQNRRASGSSVELTHSVSRHKVINSLQFAQNSQLVANACNA